VKYAKGEVYPFTHAAGLTFEKPLEIEEIQKNVEEFLKEEKNKKGCSYKQVLCHLQPYMHFPLADHCLKVAGCTNSNKKLEKFDYGILENSVKAAHELVNSIDSGQIKGVLTFDLKNEIKVYQEFSPAQFIQYKPDSLEILDTFDKAVDLFFSVVEKQKAEVTQEKQEQEIWKKKNKIQEDQERRLAGLQTEQVSSQRKAKIIESYTAEIDNLFEILKNCLNTGVNWDELFRMIVEEKHRGNPYAKIVKKLKLEKNKVEVVLEDPDTEEKVTLDLDVTKNAFQNARDYYDNKRASAIKENKTKDHIEKIIKEADKKAKIELEKQQMKLGTGVRVIRKVYWCEKFNWFISSENYLIVSGKDAQQNEIMVKRYMKKGDIYVHADMHGASSTIIKNPSGLPVPQKTLEEAGTYCVCLSSAWNNKVIQSAWWVHSNQVSKTAPTGLYLSQGSFMIRGKKNFLHPAKLEMSVVLLFKLDDNSILNHIGERKTQEILPEIPQDEQIIENEEEWSISALSTESKGQRVAKNQKVSKPQKQEKTKEKKGKNNKKEEKKEVIEKDTKNKPLTAQQMKKLKKIKEKYGDQSEEERQARLKLLGSKEVKFAHLLEKTDTEKTEEVKSSEPEDTENTENSENTENYEKSENNEKSEKSENNEKSEKSEKSESSSEDEPSASITSEDLREKTHIQQILEDENILGEEEMKALNETDSLTGTPLKEDTLLFCVPMCAPHIATTAYKYRIKLVPGNLKKGKAVNLITYTWLSMSEATDPEKQLIKAMSETELISVISGKVSIASAAVKKIQQMNKKGKGPVKS
jgi:predicted ribosome quality control (RQC) complex YloA/Tae2 family protein